MMVIDYAIKYTKEMQGATDAALGQERADNTSALIMMQKASALPLENQQARLYQFIEDIFLIWAEFMVSYYIVGRKVPMKDADGNIVYKDFTAKDKDRLIMNAKIEVGASSYWSEVTTIETLSNLLASGHITFGQYLERIPNGYIAERQKLLDEVKAIAMATPIPGEGPQEIAPTPSMDELESMATFFEGLPQELQQQLRALPPEQMEAQVRQMMAPTPS